MKHVLKQKQYRFAVIYGTLSTSRSNLWESIAEEVNSADLVAMVEDAIDM